MSECRSQATGGESAGDSVRNSEITILAIHRSAGSGSGLLQLRVLRLGFLQDGDVGVGVFPKDEEVLVCTLRLGRITCHHVGATDLEMSQCAQWEIHDDAAMVEKLL